MSPADLTIRLLNSSDLPFCTDLVRQAGWNQLDDDWLRAMALNPEGCFLAACDGIPVATTTTCRFGRIAWIAMVLVDESARNRGIGQAIVGHALQYLESAGMETIRLDATVFGKGLYEKLGFKSEYELIRFTGTAMLDEELHSGAMPVTSPQLPARLTALDERITAAPREDFLFSLHEKEPFYHFGNNLEIRAYAGARAGRNAVQIGPAIAETPASGKTVLNALMRKWNGHRVFVDIPVANIAALDWAEKIGLTEQRRFVRMSKGKKPADSPEMIWASSGPEKG